MGDFFNSDLVRVDIVQVVPKVEVRRDKVVEQHPITDSDIGSEAIIAGEVGPSHAGSKIKRAVIGPAFADKDFTGQSIPTRIQRVIAVLAFGVGQQSRTARQALIAGHVTLALTQSSFQKEVLGNVVSKPCAVQGARAEV